MISPSIPHQPGVYIYRDKSGRVIYVGKAIDLYHRIASYFSGKSRPELVGRIAKIETITVESELEALLLEANLIKKFLPAFNVRLTDDKDYLYIALTKEDFPKVVTARKKDLPADRHGLKLARKYWGPFPSSKTVRETLKSLRKVFPWCANPPKANAHTWSKSETPEVSSLQLRKFHDTVWKRRACFYYHLRLCPGVCIGMISKEDYHKIMSRFSKFMDGKKEELMKELTAEMLEESKNQKFEEASRIKKIIEGIAYLTQINRTKLYLENPNFLEEERKLALEQLQKDLNLKNLPERIEGYDISNIQGKEATGSMVVLTRGEIDKSQYRKFKISPPTGGSSKPNDVGMMAEMVRRRFKHPEWLMPDLIIIDGGRGQVRAAKFQIPRLAAKRANSKFQISIFGLAKRMEWLYPPEGEVVKLPKRSLSLKLLQKLRDEAHRFAITYHRKLHSKAVFGV